jgi:hypothetical protein
MKDRVGEIHNKLSIVAFDRRELKNSKWRYFWNCRCECGNIIVTEYSNLSQNHTKSCGCIKVKHGNSIPGKISSEYRTWNMMLQRCLNSNNDSYFKYGAVGITVCEEWLKFDNFLKDMGIKPTKNHSIDRIDGSKGYYKENCRWATVIEQNNNLKSNIKVTNIITNEEFKTIASAARSIGVSPDVLYRKLIRNSINDSNFKLMN